MTRIVRFEEIDGDRVLRVPADLAARLKFSAGDEVAVSDGDKGLFIERADERKRRRQSIIDRIFVEDDAVLDALAK